MTVIVVNVKMQLEMTSSMPDSMPKPVRKVQKDNAAAQAAVLPRIPPELLDSLVKGPMTAAAVNDASRAYKRALPNERSWLFC